MDIDELLKIRNNDIRKWTTNPAVAWRLRWHQLSTTGNISCHFCRPHQWENSRRGPKPDKYKSKRKGRC